MSLKYEWPFTQPNRIAHNLEAQHRTPHNPAALWRAGSVVRNLHPDSNVGWPNVGPIVPTLGQR